MANNAMRPDAYAMAPYNPEWKTRFEEMKEMLRHIFREKALDIQHVGSTAVPGMSAKPVVDALIVVPDISDVAVEKAELHTRGFNRAEDSIPGNSLLYSREENGKRVANVHVYPKDHERIPWFIEKRDYFLRHPEEVQRYEEVKRMLSDLYPDDYEAYQEGKQRYLNVELAQKIRHENPDAKV